MRKARKLEDMLDVFKSSPLDESNFDDFYVETSEGRGGNAAFEILFRLQKTNGIQNGILFMGHSGCGKSTELYKIRKELSNRYEVVSFSIREEADVFNLNYVDFIFTIMSNVFHMVQEKNLKMDAGLLDNLYAYWNDDVIREVTNIKKLEGEAEYKAKLSFLTLMSASVRGIFQLGSESKETIRSRIEPKLKQLIRNINDIIDDINGQLWETGKQLLIIIEDLDKLDIAVAEELFVKRRKSIVSLRANIIYTFPIFLFYSMSFSEIKNDFDDYVLLSMIKVKNKDKSSFESGINALKKVVHQRSDENLIAEEALNFMIEKSGGAMRNLFDMIENAVFAAKMRDSNSGTIVLEDAEKSYLKIRSSYERIISKPYVQPLIDLYHDENKKPLEGEETIMELLKTMAIIEYNGERWCDLNPAVEDYLREVGAIT